MNADHLYAIIVAGGSGTRMNAPIPKQYMTLAGLPIIMHTIQAFYTFDSAMKIILVLPKGDFSYWESLCKQYAFDIPVTLSEGGATRFESVKNGLSKIKEESGIVAVHDGVRPLVSQSLLENIYKVAQKHGNAVASITLKDSLRKVINGENHAVDRSQFRLVQTPQAFSTSIIKKAYSEADSAHFTDDASVVEAIGFGIHLIEGAQTNIKITTPEDLYIAECFIKANIKG